MSLNILMVSFDYLPKIGGIAAHILYLSQELKSLDHHVTVLNPIIDRKQSPGTIIESNDHSISTIRITVAEHNNKLASYLAKYKGVLKGLHYAQNKYGPFDIIHQHDYVDSATGLRFYNDKIAKLIWTNHSSHFINDQPRKLKLKLIKYIYGNINGIISVSQERFDAANRTFDKRMTYIPNGVDVNKFTHTSTEKKKSEKFSILCPSRVSEVKGQLYLAEAIHLIANSNPGLINKLQFVFVGTEIGGNTSQKYILKIKNRLSKYIDCNTVKLLGSIPVNQMPKQMEEASIIVMPSLMEGISLSALEAMAMRKPLITTQVGGMPEIVKHEDTGLLVPPRDPSALANAILRLFNDTELQIKLAENAYIQVIDKFTWHNIAKSTVDFYNKILAQP
jgi:hypothetical protein